MQKVEFFSILFTDSKEHHYDFKNKKQMLLFNRQVLKYFPNYYIENFIINNITGNSYELEYNKKADTLDRKPKKQFITKYNKPDYNIIHLEYDNNYITSEV